MRRPRADHRALKVAFLFIGMPVGGAEDFALGVYPHLAPEVDARFVCLRELGMLGEEALAAGWPVELMPLFPKKRISPLAVWKLSRWLQREGIDVVHSQTYHAHLFGVAAARLSGVAAILHQQKTLGEMPLRKRVLFQLCLRGAKKILTLSAQTRAEISSRFSIPSSLVEVLPNAIDDDLFRPTVDDKRVLRKSLGLPEDEILFGTVASLHPVKNHKATIEALVILRRRGLRPKAVFVGDGVARKELENFALEQGVGEQIVFAGRQRPSVPWFQALDFFVLPSFWEGQALALLQAISCRLPVIVSRIEGNTAVLGENHAGYFEPNDSAKLAELIASATTDAASREALLARNAAIPTCRDAARHLKRIYSEIA
ncbi:MAG: glycosyltransferase [Verrucomicrobia bacterium]|nr:glycosyltransferase [Verrucomicrobiota bacterium]